MVICPINMLMRGKKYNSFFSLLTFIENGYMICPIPDWTNCAVGNCTNEFGKKHRIAERKNGEENSS